MEIPVIPSSGFNSKEVKKAYRGLAKTYHPDKIANLPEEEQEEAKGRWYHIARGYETLTTEEKFDNWMKYGNPDGSSFS